MFSTDELKGFLILQNADFEFIKQNRPIYSAMDAEGYYPVEKSAPTFILESDDGLLACTMSVGSGRLDFEALKRQFGYARLKMAHREKIEKKTGCKVGSVPLIGHGLPCIFDDNLLVFDYVYGGTGDEMITLKIAPRDIKRLNRVIHILNGDGPDAASV